MRLQQYVSIGQLATLAVAQGQCRFGNGTLLPDVPEWNIYQPCPSADGPSTICCALNRENKPWGNISLGFTQDECLPNGLCQNRITTNEGQPATTWFVDYCTEYNQPNSAGKCLNICPTASLELTAKITPCDGTATSSRWCCGDTRGCCDSNTGVVLLEQVLGQVSSSVISSSSSATSSSTSTSSQASASAASSAAASSSPTDANSSNSGSSGLSGGAIAGIVIGALAGLALIAAALFFARRSSQKKKAAYSAQPAVAEVPYSPAPNNPERQELGSTVKYAHVQEMPGAPPGELQGDMPAHAHKP